MASPSPIMQKLIQIPICRGLTESEANVIFEIAEEASMTRGQRLFSEGETGDALYAILEGHIDITKRDHQGTEQLLARLGEGSVLGEMSLIGGDSRRSANAIAATDGRLLKIAAHRFSRLLRNDNIAALKIVHNLAQVMSRRLQQMNEKLVDSLNRTKKKEELQEFQKLLNNWSF
ncbi:MAG: cyclic nucleotide-binding domain-containing protein [Myxococcaceae bacterium]|nr:cyclic nucleotide-binding domain-containing protein [Myxococcaceae bacterium]